MDVRLWLAVISGVEVGLEFGGGVEKTIRRILVRDWSVFNVVS